MKHHRGLLHLPDVDVPKVEWEECLCQGKFDPVYCYPPATSKKIAKARKQEWHKVGEIGIDSGTCWVGDPGYVIHPDASEKLVKTWDEFCDKLMKKEKRHVAQWGKWTGVTTGTGEGDGLYPVYVKRNTEGRVMAVLVDFMGVIQSK
jgi:hypothetical protein